MTPIMSYARVMPRPGFVGTCIGPYHVLDIVSTSSLDMRLLARHILTNCSYLIRVVDMCYLRNGVSTDPHVIAELSKLRMLRHPNLVLLYEVHASATHVFIVTEVAVGQQFLDSMLSWRCIDEGTARNIFRKLLDAVALCHTFGLYHRELCAENVILTASGDVKIAGFSFSYLKDSTSRRLPPRSLSVHYSAPEVWTRSRREYNGAKADAFSLGVILYILLTSTRPFDDISDVKILSKVHACHVVYPSYLSGAAVDLLGRLLVRNPVQRLSLGMVKVHPWCLARGIWADGLPDECSYLGEGIYAPVRAEFVPRGNNGWGPVQ